MQAGARSMEEPLLQDEGRTQVQQHPVETGLGHTAASASVVACDADSADDTS